MCIKYKPNFAFHSEDYGAADPYKQIQTVLMLLSWVFSFHFFQISNLPLMGEELHWFEGSKENIIIFFSSSCAKIAWPKTFHKYVSESDIFLHYKS